MSLDMPAPIPQPPCQCFTPLELDVEFSETGCVCGETERALRAGVSLTSAQRIWCLEQIASVEGYGAAEHSMASDKELGAAVLSAWTDYCRDKGLM